MWCLGVPTTPTQVHSNTPGLPCGGGSHLPSLHLPIPEIQPLQYSGYTHVTQPPSRTAGKAFHSLCNTEHHEHIYQEKMGARYIKETKQYTTKNIY